MTLENIHFTCRLEIEYKDDTGGDAECETLCWAVEGNGGVGFDHFVDEFSYCWEDFLAEGTARVEDLNDGGDDEV